MSVTGADHNADLIVINGCVLTMLGQIRRGVTPEINAISTAFLLLSVAIVTLFFFVSRKRD